MFHQPAFFRSVTSPGPALLQVSEMFAHMAGWLESYADVLLQCVGSLEVTGEDPRDLTGHCSIPSGESGQNRCFEDVIGLFPSQK